MTFSSADRADVCRRLAVVLQAESGNVPDDLTEDVRIREGLGLDSVDLMSAVTRVEEMYRVRFTHQDLEQIATIGHLIDAIQSKSRPSP